MTIKSIAVACSAALLALAWTGCRDSSPQARVAAAPPAAVAHTIGGVPLPSWGAPAGSSRGDVDERLASIEQRVGARGAVLSSDLAEADLAITEIAPRIGEPEAKRRLAAFNVRMGLVAQELAARPRAQPSRLAPAPAPASRVPRSEPPLAGWEPPPPPPPRPGP